jgi:hypothetical protein
MVDRLVQKIRGAGLQRFVEDGLVVDDGYNDDRYIRAAWQGTQAAGEFNTVQFRHFVIGDNEIGRILLGYAQRGDRIIEGPDSNIVANGLEDAFQDDAAGKLIINDHDRGDQGVALDIFEQNGSHFFTIEPSVGPSLCVKSYSRFLPVCRCRRDPVQDPLRLLTSTYTAPVPPSRGRAEQ